MGVPAVRLSEKSRKRLGLASAVANFICVLPSLVLFGLGGYMQVAIQDKVDLIPDYAGHFLPPMIVSLGFIYLVVNLAGGKICLDNAKPENRRKQRFVFAIYIYVSSIMCGLIILTSIFCFSQIINLHKAFHNGISVAMKKYRFNLRLKEAIDKLQIEFKCCGNTGYTDWFSTPWIDEQYLALDSTGVQRRLTSGHYLNDDTPFSCCNVAAIRPCIHHRVQENSNHYNYDYAEELTIYTLGCRDALVNIYGGQLLTNVGIIILIISLLQIIVVVCARFLQTSSLMSIKQERPMGSADGWLLPWPNPAHDIADIDDNASFVEHDASDTSVSSIRSKSPSEAKGKKDEPLTLEDQSYSTHGLGGPPAPPPIPPSFGAAFNESNNHSNINFHNHRRFPVAPPPPSPVRPPVLSTPPRLPPPPGDRRRIKPSTPCLQRPSPLLVMNRKRENIPFRRQSARTLERSIPIYQNGFYRNSFIDK